jgi:phosphoglycerol transferase MdoB-like AlkP superfamily enzyme
MDPTHLKVSRPSPFARAACLAALFAVFVAWQAVLRLVFLVFNADAAAGVPAVTLLHAFATGLRFDIAIAAYAVLPALLVAFALADPFAHRRWIVVPAILLVIVLGLLAVIELDFYAEFHQRLNDVAIVYLTDDPRTVLSMVARGFPVARRLMLLVAMSVVPCVLVWRIVPHVLRLSSGGQDTRLRRAGVFLLVLVLLVAAGRGRLGAGPPLRWGDATFSEFAFANHLALNAPFALASAFRWSTGSDVGSTRFYTAPDIHTRARVQMLLAGPADEPVDGEAARRQHTSTAAAPVARHLVVILMESFAARFTGAVRGYPGITPQFDALAAHGALFMRFFSNGTHTHQGTFATLASFPNLPGHEYLMEQPEGAQRFSGFHTLLRDPSRQMLYVYNGDYRWDNQRGFFQDQGLDQFIGRDDFVHPKVLDPTWGVSDEDVFARALEELDHRTANGPVFAVLQTLSNHTPFTLPPDAPVAPVTDAGRLNEHLTAMRYADWALGRFFAAAATRPYFAETLFVLLGDHGITAPGQSEELDVERFQVPLLIIGPGVERLGMRVWRVASQVDVVPTVMELMGRSYRGQCWGRDLVNLPPDDPGFAVVKPSGLDPIVGIFRGDTLLIRMASGERLYRWRTGRELSFVSYDDADVRARLRDDLRAYLTSAREKLQQRDVAP